MREPSGRGARGSAAHAHELGERLVGHGGLLQVLGGLGGLLPAVHEDQHLLLTRVPQHLHQVSACVMGYAVNGIRIW